MKDEQLELILETEKIPYDTVVDLKKKTWIHRGGFADYYIMPDSSVALQIVMTYLYQNGIRYLLVGSTSNLYILNSTNIPVVVSTLRCNAFEVKDGTIECECGVQVSKLARQMIERGIKGFEFLTKLPGTVGAAIYNNSSVKSEKNSISELLLDIDLLTSSGIRKVKKDELHFSFRSSDLKKHIIQGTILRARLAAMSGNVTAMQQIAKENEELRFKILEGPVQNLGCTLDKPFCNGPMPIRYRLPNSIYSKTIGLLVRDELKQKKLKKEFLLRISGYEQLIPYVSDKLFVTFIWKDEKADDVFEDYLQFMKEVFKTDNIEIEVIK